MRSTMVRTLLRQGRLLLLAVLISAPISIAGVPAAGQSGKGSAEAAVSRLSDQEVRDLLIKQLTAAKAQQAVEEFNPAVIMYRFQRGVGKVSKELSGIFAAVVELPDVFPRAWAAFTADRDKGGLAWFVLALVVSMGAGGASALFLRARLTRVIGNFDDRRPESVRGKVAVLGSRFLMHLVYVVVFVAVAAAVFILFFDEGPKDRIAFFFYLAASAIFLTTIALSIAFHAPYQPVLRLPLYSDTDALSLHKTVLITVGFGAFAYFTCALLGTLGILGEVHELFLISVGTTTIGLLIYTVVSGRQAITGDIAGDAAPDSSRAMFARVWPWIIPPFLAVLWVGIVIRELLYDFVPYGAALFTIGLIIAVPSIDALLSREARRFQEAGGEIDAALAKGTRIGMIVLTVAAMAVAWRINPFAAGGGIGGQVINVLLQITVTLLVAYAVWQLARIFIDKKIAEEDAVLAEQGIDVSEGEGGGEGLSRTRTLLPLIRRTVQITLIAISVMIIFGSLGVDIAPLLAGAGVIGLAIGFGSQTLVRDVVSGAFFLMDDAFRIAEYIDVGAVKGTVEKISIRSVRLRHHRGAVHTVPFGEIKTLTNFSRDWAIMKLTFNVPFDTNIDKVRKLMKRVGLALAEVEEIKDDFIQPFKSQGALAVNDFGFVISTKFMSKPGKQFFIRRHAFNAVQKAFQENGIEFATPKVEVRVEVDGNPEEAAAEAARSTSSVAVAGAAGAEMIRAAKPAAQ